MTPPLKGDERGLALLDGTAEPLITAARNNYADRLSQVARQKETRKGLGAAFHQVVTGY